MPPITLWLSLEKAAATVNISLHFIHKGPLLIQLIQITAYSWDIRQYYITGIVGLNQKD